ncbi:MAG: serine hydrolase [Bacteroidetes bacterium]|jgi:CubicO group peptidase (beta-lactamase class C family)|nr:serine hydrolase [Bacteroidota bacterium]
MRRFLFILVLALAPASLHGQDLYFPPTDGTTWETVAPETLGWSQAALDTTLAFLERENTKAFLVLKDGRLAVEHYFGTFTADSLWAWFSAGKTLTAVLVGLAQEQGTLSIDDPTATYLGQGWTSLSPEREDSITVWHQLTMTTGLDERVSFACTLPGCLRYRAPAGTRWVYHNAPYTLLRDVVEAATGQGYNTYTRSALADRIGMDGFWVRNGFNSFFLSTARSMARFGLMMLADGRWAGEAILPDTAYVRAMTRPSQSMNPSYGYLWWLNGQAQYIAPGATETQPGPIAPAAPADLYVAAGAQGQFISVVPSQNLVMVRIGRTGTTNPVPLDLHDAIWQRLAAVMDDAVSTSSTDPLPSAPAITVYPTPTTGEVQFSYALPAGGPVHLAVYDLRGRRLATLVEGRRPAGRHRLVYDTSGLPSGVYLYRLTTGEQQRTGTFVRLR